MCRAVGLALSTSQAHHGTMDRIVIGSCDNHFFALLPQTVQGDDRGGFPESFVQV